MSVPLLDAAQARAGDEAAVAAGATWEALMVRAAGHLARGVVAAAGHGYGLKVAVVAGKGDNGGDGWAVARRLRDEHGARCWVVAVAGTDTDASEATTEQRRRWIASGGRTSAGLDDLDAALAWADVAVDALLGTGIDGAPRGAIGDACRALVAAHDDGLRVVACDVPSGVSSDDGAAGEGAVVADLTVTFGGLKRGLVLHPGAAHAGRVVVGELGHGYAPPAAPWRALTAAGAAPTPYDRATDKRERGVVGLVAGSVGAAGAAILATRGALAAGAGLVTLSTPANVQRTIAPVVPPAMTRRLAHEGLGVSVRGAAELELDHLDAVAAGPGLTPSEGTRAVADRLLAEAPRVVLDADALNVFRDDPSPLAEHTGELVLTPHARELARIGGGDDGEDAWRHRASRVPELAERYRATVLCKGPGTLVAAPDGRVWVTPTGSAALGTGGAGDVLTGMLAAAVATATDVPLAVARTVWLHGLAGRLAGAGCAGRASADDLVAHLAEAHAWAATAAHERPAWPFTDGWHRIDAGGRP
jgi:ADP-dependent NAD(P)H-hydrate dehydratase / NAD(P)H-hydrate epimerase